MYLIRKFRFSVVVGLLLCLSRTVEAAETGMLDFSCLIQLQHPSWWTMCIDPDELLEARFRVTFDNTLFSYDAELDPPSIPGSGYEFVEPVMHEIGSPGTTDELVVWVKALDDPPPPSPAVIAEVTLGVTNAGPTPPDGWFPFMDGELPVNPEDPVPGVTVGYNTAAGDFFELVVPEPGSFSLLSWAGLLLLTTRRRFVRG